MAGEPRQPATPAKAKLGVHVHLPGVPLHDDHLCTHVVCALCGAPGRVIAGVWIDLTL